MMAEEFHCRHEKMIISVWSFRGLFNVQRLTGNLNLKLQTKIQPNSTFKDTVKLSYTLLTFMRQVVKELKA